MLLITPLLEDALSTHPQQINESLKFPIEIAPEVKTSKVRSKVRVSVIGRVRPSVFTLAFERIDL